MARIHFEKKINQNGFSLANNIYAFAEGYYQK